jgi:uncharacterized iron-regulated membrane protein
MTRSRRWMALFARWHIWLGWLVAVPLLLWTISGVAMVLKPIEEVRGESLRLKPAPVLIPPDAQLISKLGQHGGVVEVTQRMAGDPLIAIFTFADGRQTRYDFPSEAALPGRQAGEDHARALVAREVRGGDQVIAARFFDEHNAPLDLRKPIPAWQLTLADGTHVYVGSTSGRIEAIRTRWWRFYDFMWGLHIMDLQTREDAHNPFVIGFGLLALIGALLGTVLLFRRRKARPV